MPVFGVRHLYAVFGFGCGNLSKLGQDFPTRPFVVPPLPRGPKVWLIFGQTVMGVNFRKRAYLCVNRKSGTVNRKSGYFSGVLYIAISL